MSQSTIEAATIWTRTRAAILDVIIIGLLQGVINMTFGSERITWGRPSLAYGSPASMGARPPGGKSWFGTCYG